MRRNLDIRGRTQATTTSNKHGPGAVSLIQSKQLGNPTEAVAIPAMIKQAGEAFAPVVASAPGVAEPFFQK